MTDLTQKTHCRHNCLCLGLAWIPLMYGSEETGGHWTGGYTSIRVPPRSPVHLPAVLFSCFYVWQIGDGDTAYTDNRELATVHSKADDLDQSATEITAFSLFADEDQDERVPASSPIAASILSRHQRTFSLTSEKCGENAGKTTPPFSSDSHRQGRITGASASLRASWLSRPCVSLLHQTGSST